MEEVVYERIVKVRRHYNARGAWSAAVFLPKPVYVAMGAPERVRVMLVGREGRMRVVIEPVLEGEG